MKIKKKKIKYPRDGVLGKKSVFSFGINAGYNRYKLTAIYLPQKKKKKEKEKRKMKKKNPTKNTKLVKLNICKMFRNSKLKQVSQYTFLF